VRYPYVGESIGCNLCGSTNSLNVCRTDRRWKRLLTVVCEDCGLLRTDPMPTDAELEFYYRSQYRLEYQLAANGPPKSHIVRSTRKAQDRVQLLKPWLKPGSRVLDLGCGTGEFLRLARDLGCHVIGVEPGESYAEHARRTHGIDVLSEPWRALKFDQGSFDLITTNHVLEHLRDPVDAIAAMSWWLKDDGALYMAVPDMRPNHKPAFERFHFAHIHGFIPATLEAAARRHGLQPADGKPLATTAGVFTKIAEGAPQPADALTDRRRAHELVRAYADSSILQYVISGKSLAAGVRRLRRWVRDSRAPADQAGRP
jgi:SAM-dependent methyltransferase